MKMEIQDRFLDLMFPYMNVSESAKLGKLLNSTKSCQQSFQQ